MYKNDFEKLKLILRGDATETVFETPEFREIIAPMLQERKEKKEEGCTCDDCYSTECSLYKKGRV
jgi:hypothetical protein